MKHLTNISRMPENRLACLAAVSLSLLAVSTSHALESTSTVTGGVFNDSATWQVGGVPVSGGNNTFYLQSGAEVTLNSDFASTYAAAPVGIAKLDNATLNIASSGMLRFNGALASQNQAAIYFAAGSSTVNIQSGGYVYSPRVTFNTAVSGNLNISGTLTTLVGGLNYGANSSATITLNTGGVYQTSATGLNTSVNAGSSSVYNISGGTMIFSNPSGVIAGSSHSSVWNVSSGTVDYSGYGFAWGVPLANFNWTGGTMANVSGIVHAPMLNVVLGDFGSSANTRIDINNQRVSDTAKTWDIANTALSKNQGTIQFDIYDTASSDAIEGGTGAWNLTTGVKIEIGFAGDLITNAEDYIGQSFNLFTGFSNYAGLNAEVLAALWFDGINYWEITFDSNLSTDGSVTIASMTAVPEPSVIGLAVAGLGLALFRHRKTRRSATSIA